MSKRSWRDNIPDMAAALKWAEEMSAKSEACEIELSPQARRKERMFKELAEAQRVISSEDSQRIWTPPGDAERQEKATSANEQPLLQVAHVTDRVMYRTQGQNMPNAPAKLSIGDFSDTSLSVPDAERGKVDEFPTSSELEGVPLHVTAAPYAQ
ncbi:hypothetical protein EVJ58_g1614 [Rhodofomes roseus]|uniref:Uncharacterized protein n=1 Tax=Rhodofomes roseus TaxID=34475 RepID=A0A4Y9Z0S8_9APHY|nr:hypothetical protein EVJ58_g1614 [Rhodofomes roseus]